MNNDYYDLNLLLKKSNNNLNKNYYNNKVYNEDIYYRKIKKNNYFIDEDKERLREEEREKKLRYQMMLDEQVREKRIREKMEREKREKEDLLYDAKFRLDQKQINEYRNEREIKNLLQKESVDNPLNNLNYHYILKRNNSDISEEHDSQKKKIDFNNNNIIYEQHTTPPTIENLVLTSNQNPNLNINRINLQGYYKTQNYYYPNKNNEHLQPNYFISENLNPYMTQSKPFGHQQKIQNSLSEVPTNLSVVPINYQNNINRMISSSSPSITNNNLSQSNYFGTNNNNINIVTNMSNIDINKIHYLLLLIKAIKILKIFKKNIAAKRMKKYLYEFEFFNDWGDVFIYSLIFLSFLNFSSCIFIFIGRNIYESWIFYDGLQTKSFIDIYIASIYYLMMTVTTVGYGDVIGKSTREILFQIIMVIIGTCIYSWLISTVSNYVKKMNEKNIIYQEKMKVLEDIRLNSPNLSEKLYNKILKLLNYRKYHEEETGKNIILENLPNSLRHTLIIDMYKNYINGFSFFKGVENREFIVKVISKLTPIFGSKGDILIQEGEYIEEIIFIKNGTLSLEVWIDMANPEDSIKKYLYENGFITQKGRRESVHHDHSSIHLRSSVNSIFGHNKKNLNTSFNTYFEKIDKSTSMKTTMLSVACATGITFALGCPLGGVLFSIESTASIYMVSNLWKSFFSSVICCFITKIF